MMSSYKVVLTGGPCGGKTESLPFLKHKLVSRGMKVIIISETARALLSLNYMPGDNIPYFDFQNLLFKIQFIKEYLNENSANIAICDRGLLDAKIYMDNNDFRNLLYQNRVKEKEITSTYDVALYYRTIAYEYPETFQRKRIYELPELGIKRDKKSLEIWNSKLLKTSYSNFGGFENKKKYLYETLVNYIDSLDVTQVVSLSDYYSQDIIPFLLTGINKIMDDNKVPEDIQIKTRRLIK